MPTVKTQLVVTVTQTGDAIHHATPTLIERELREVVKSAFANDTTTVTVRHIVEPPEPADDTLEALVREYGNAPATGNARTRADVMRSIRELIGTTPDAEPARAPVDVEAAVESLNKTEDTPVSVGKQSLHDAIRDGHRAGQLTGRLLGKAGVERASEYADAAVADLLK